jgi:dTDP-4-amino-4,6-dideoxygalactose transaminase
MIPFSKITAGQEEIDAVAKVIRSGWLAAGPETEAFEQEFSAYISPPGEHYYCIFTNSCTSALKMAYKWALEQGYEAYCLMEPNTFCATYAAAEEMGLHEVRIGDNLDRTAYVTTHYGGIKDLRTTEPTVLIEDSAHRIEPNDPLVGKIRCYSFYATKNMTTGSGGMFVTADKEIYDRARLYWKDGLSAGTADRLLGSARYEVLAMAGGYDGNDLAAAIGRVQLAKLPSFTERREHVRARYNGFLGQDWAGNRDEEQAYDCIAFMRGRGIMCGHHYPGTGWNGVSLPIYPLLTDAEQDEVISACLDYASRVR